MHTAHVHSAARAELQQTANHVASPHIRLYDSDIDRTARWRGVGGSRLSSMPALAPDSESDSEPEPEPEPEREVAVTFAHDGPIGIRFRANEDASYAVEILAVADDVQEDNPGLGPGLSLTHVSGEDVVRHSVVARILKAYETRQN